MDGSLINTQPAEKLAWRENILASILSNIQTGQLQVTFPSGAQVTFVGHAQVLETVKPETLRLRSWSSIARILFSGATGLGESYMDGEWETDNLTQLLCLLAANMDVLEAQKPNIVGLRMFEKFKHFLNRNTKAGSRKNIAYHYDLGNDFYSLWLDETMSYSAAIFKAEGMSLTDAQTEKYARLARELDIQPNDHVLEIGCGWGGFAEYITTELGCRIDCITLSQEQLVFAENRLRKAPNSGIATFSLTDYRDVEGTYDKIVSIEMLEAVGEAYWSQYFSKIKSLLKPGGSAGIQVITIDDARFEGYRTGADFIQKHIFPGGMLPSDKLFRQHTTAADMVVQDEFDFGTDYADTIAFWRDAFIANLSAVKSAGFDDRFVNMWLFYFAYCEAGFRQKTISVKQYVIG